MDEDSLSMSVHCISREKMNELKPNTIPVANNAFYLTNTAISLTTNYWLIQPKFKLIDNTIGYYNYA